MTYPGGKAADGTYHQIINQIPPHKTFIDCFYGGGGISQNKREADRSFFVDIDPQVIREGKKENKIKNSHFIKKDAMEFLRKYPWRGGEFVYVDPPYLKSTRRSKRPVYGYEFWTEEQHNELLDVLLSLPCMVALSGYNSELYADRLSNWRTIHFQVGTRGGTVATEWLWMNYDEPTRLHDYQYYGKNYRDREKINRIKRKLRARLLKYPELKRYAILSGIEDLFE